MLHACFSIAHIIAYTACTDFSHCSRYGNSDIETSLTEHILFNCFHVRSLKDSFQQITFVKFGRSTFNMLASLIGKEYVEALFGLNPNLHSVLLNNYDMFYKHVVLFLDNVWKSYYLYRVKQILSASFHVMFVVTLYIMIVEIC